MRVTELYKKLSSVYPEENCEEWDNDGLEYIAGDREIDKVLISLDLTQQVLKYAAENGFSLILTHHPFIFKAIDDLNNPVIDTLIKNNIAVISLHTRLDCGEGGVNDILAGKLGLENISQTGMGRVGFLPKELDAASFANEIKKALRAPYVRYTKQSDKTIKKVAVLGGAGVEFYFDALREDADAFVTGEVKHNFFADFMPCDAVLYEAGHYYTEFPVCTRLKELCKEFGTGSEIYLEKPFFEA